MRAKQNFRNTYLEVNLFSLAKNYAELRNELAPESFFCPMVKANAYGHGDVQVSRVLQQLGCTSLGVAFIEEGIRLRERQVAGEIYVFTLFDGEGARALIEYELIPVISSFESLETLRHVLSQARDQRYPVHVELNTGMNRLGFAPEQALELLEYFRSHPEVELRGLCTHLSHAEDAGEPMGRTTQALEQFYAIEKIFAPLKPVTHVYNSAGLINSANILRRKQKLPPTQRWPDGARPGIALYGYDSGVRPPSDIRLEPVASLRSQAIKYHELKAGESVSYSGIWTAPHKCSIGVVPIGYADGYPRQLSNKAFVLFRGQRVPVIGHICMDYLMIDVTAFARDELRIGEEVVLWGEQGGQRLSLQELAAQLGTIPYTLLTGVSERVIRKYIQD